VDVPLEEPELEPALESELEPASVLLLDSPPELDVPVVVSAPVACGGWHRPSSHTCVGSQQLASPTHHNAG
jgi:hypothetical protein